MIFKWLTYDIDSEDNGYYEIWHFVDNVKESYVFWNEEAKCTCIHLSFKDGDYKYLMFRMVDICFPTQVKR